MNKLSVNRKYIYSLKFGSMTLGVAITLLFQSFFGAIELPWEVPAVIFFGALGISTSTTMILLGHDSDQYQIFEEREE